MGSDDDFALLERWRAGEREAGNALVEKYFAAVRCYFLNAVSDEDRGDLVNETFRRLMDAMTRFKGKCSVRTLIYRVARNVLNDHLRSRYRREGRFEPLTHSVEDVGDVTPSQALERLQRYRRLLALLRAMPVEIKQLMEEFYWHDLTAAELGEIHEIPAATVRTRLHAARERLKTALATERGPEATDEDLEAELRTLGRLLTQGPREI